MTVATFIEANAGTGKTYELTSFILQKVLEGVPLKNICAVTFTEKAATEMVERLRSRMADLVAKGEMEARKLEEANQGFIGTIHAFCTQVLKRHGSRLGLTPLFEVDADESHFEELFDAHWDRFLSGVLRGERHPYPKLIEMFGIEKLTILAQTLTSRRLNFQKPQDDSIEWLFDLIETPEAWNLNTNLKWESAFLNGLKNREQHLASLTFLMSPSQPQLLKNTEWKGAVRDALYFRNNELYEAIHSLQRDFVRNLLEEYRGLGYLRFDDLIVDTRNLLRDHTDVRGRLKKRYQAVLVDEMQDTDPVQYEIFLYLCEQDSVESDFRLHDLASGKFHLKLQPGKLFVAGDPKQSIYGFRGADPNAYQTIKSILGKESLQITHLTGNWRSCKNLVEFTNALAENLFPLEEPEPSQTIKDYCPGHPVSDCVHLIRIESDQDDALHLRILCEANWLAKSIAEAAEQKPEGEKYRGTAILLRRLTSSHLYVDALTARGIPVVIEGEKFFFLSQEVIDFVNLLKWIVDNMDMIAMAATLRSPLFGLNDLELALFFTELNRASDSRPSVAEALSAALQDSTPTRVQTLQQFLISIKAIRECLSELTPGKFLDEVLSRFPILSLAAISYGSHRRELAPMNILRFHKQALEADLDPLISPYSFVKKLERYSRDAKDLGQEVVADEGVDAIRILSIHRAKGLDFPVAYIGLTDYGIIGYRDRMELKHDWRTDTSALRLDYFTEANYLNMKYSDRSAFGKPRKTTDFELELDEEERRVLYVAATRAKHEMFFTLAGSEPKNSGKNIMEFLELIHPDVQSITENGEPWLPSDIFRKSSTKISLAPVLGAWNDIEVARTKCALPKLSSITAEASLAKTNPVFTTPIRAEVTEDQPETEWEFVSMHARIVGLLCHGVLERIDFQSPKNFRTLLEIEKAKLTDAHSLQALNEAETEAESILEKFLKSEAAQWLASLEIIGREIPVCVFDSKQNKVLTGTIDLLAKNKSNQHFLIDYKTVDDVDDDSMSAYKRQMELYSEAVGVTCDARLCLLRSGKILRLSGKS
jgi:ATP-dependent helicase/nuclease subunit A